MQHFELFALPHLFVLLSIPALAAILARSSQAFPATSRWIRSILAWSIVANELIWYGYLFGRGWITFPHSLPLHLCDLVIWLTVYTCFKLSNKTYELVYYWGLAGTSMAILTPDVSSPFFSYFTIRFFLSHGLVIIAILYLFWSRQLHPTRKSFWRALIGLNIFAAVVGAFNLIFKTNYMFLCEKPGSASLLDYFGLWPWYLIVSELFGITLFFFLWIPFRKGDENS